VAWGICEWFGTDVRLMSPDERRKAANQALSSELDVLCPFLQHISPGALCNKEGGVCSIVDYNNLSESQDREPRTVAPAAVCPSRLMAVLADGDVTALGYLAERCFGVPSSQARAIKEVPFLNKIDTEGKIRNAAAGRIDWVVVVWRDGTLQDWMPVETQAVYFSGAKMSEDMKAYKDHPESLQVTTKSRRPDWRSSGAKRLSPQLDAKAPVVRRWGKKIGVIVDSGFFAELSGFTSGTDSFDNAEVVWLVVGYTADLRLFVERLQYAELDESIRALQATRPVEKRDFEAGLVSELTKARSRKVYRV